MTPALPVVDHATAPAPAASTPAGPCDRPALAPRLVLGVFIAVPFLALVAAVPMALLLGRVTWLDLALLGACYVVAVHGITVGYHRLFTHRSFRAAPWLRATLAVAGSLAVEGRLSDWVADHRRHHQSSDEAGDPHSPWEYGTSALGVARGLWHAHVGWLFTYAGTDVRRYAPDLLDDPVTARISRWWPALAVTSLAAPAVLAGLVTWSWSGLLQAFFWASLVRVALVHHMTWSINSVCHVWGRRPFVTRDRSANVAWLAPLSGGESWHNYHHADPTSARHGVLPRQLDTSAWLIRAMERLGWVHAVRWPDPARVAARRRDAVSELAAAGAQA